jgi:tripartite-type tricarboxylate transporter receptor subunit TctC
MAPVSQTIIGALAAVVFALLPSAARAQAFPSKPIRIVVEFIPGSGGDSTARILAGGMAEVMGQPVIVDNKPGAGGLLAAEIVSRAPPDGYTLLSSSPNVPLMRQFMVRNNTFDVLRDLTPITVATPTTIALVANPSVAAASLRELIDYAKRNPGKLSYGSSGIGSAHHLSGEQLKMLTGVDMVHVPYKGTQQALLDTVAGQLPLTYILANQALPHIRSGKVKALAVVDDTRSTLLPDVPAFNEVVPGFKAPPSWQGVFGPPNMPDALLKQLNAQIARALAEPKTREKIRGMGLETGGQSAEEFVALIKSHTALIGNIVKSAGIQPTE